MALWWVLDYTKLNADIAEIIFDLGFDWRKERDSLRDIIFLRLLSLYSPYTSLIFIISLSLSRRGCKQPFHRLFGRLVFAVVYCIVFNPTSNPFESTFSNVKTKRTGKFLPVRFVWRSVSNVNRILTVLFLGAFYTQKLLFTF